MQFRKVLLLFASLVFTTIGFAGDPQFETEKFDSFIRIWGIMKYYHPYVAKKKIDWDDSFTTYYSRIKSSGTVEEYNNELKSMLGEGKLFPREFSEIDKKHLAAIERGELSTLPNFKELADTNVYKLKPDFSWIGKAEGLDASTKQLIYQVLLDHKKVQSKYATPFFFMRYLIVQNEAEIKGELTEAQRMLGLARYWNIFQYYYPYKHLMDQNWDVTLHEAIPKFLKTTSNAEYTIAVKQLSALTNDSHTSITALETAHLDTVAKPDFKKYFSPGIIVNCENRKFYVVKSKYEGVIQENDEILAINGKNVSEIIDSALSQFSLSGHESVDVLANNAILGKFLTPDSLPDIVLKRGDETIEVKDIKGIKAMEYVLWLFPYLNAQKRADSFKMYGESIAYYDLTTIKLSQLKKAYRAHRNAETMIFDMRGYPKHSSAPSFIPRILSKKPITIARFTKPSVDFPGAFKRGKERQTYFSEFGMLAFIKAPLGINAKIVPTFNRIYKGKIIVLIDGGAQSHAETVCMMFKAYAPNATFIGSPTQGANGNVVHFAMPGGLDAGFAILNYHFPDGSRIQRVGVQPDIFIKPTAESKREGKDVVLERALEFASSTVKIQE